MKTRKKSDSCWIFSSVLSDLNRGDVQRSKYWISLYLDLERHKFVFTQQSNCFVQMMDNSV